MKKKGLKIKYQILRNCLYVLGGILFVYYGYLLYEACSYIGNLVKIGEIKMSSDIGKVIQYIMTATFSYLFYSISILSLGYIVSLCGKANQEEMPHEEKQ